MNEPHSWYKEPPLSLQCDAREQDILDMAIENYAIKEIAEEMNISETEVRQVIAKFSHKLEESM